MTSSDLEAPVKGDSVHKLRNWCSLWADLLHVDMVLHGRDQFSADDARLVFVRRALWEGAVIAYGRTVGPSSRQLQVTELLPLLGEEAEACHHDVLQWRNRHVAHRQDRARELLTAHAVLDPEARRVTGIRVRVAPSVAPEDDGGELAERLRAHVYELRNLVWEQRIRPLEAEAIAACASDVEVLCRLARPVSGPRSFALTIDPSG
ncbi:MAG: hypothetical protein ACTHOE_07440 [Conexibacter sp.]